MNNRRSIPFAASVVGVVAMLVTAAPASADGAEDYFLNELYKTHQKWYWPYGEGYIIGVARGICDDWAAGVPYTAEVEGQDAVDSAMKYLVFRFVHRFAAARPSTSAVYGTPAAQSSQMPRATPMM